MCPPRDHSQRTSDYGPWKPQPGGKIDSLTREMAIVSQFYHEFAIREIPYMVMFTSHGRVVEAKLGPTILLVTCKPLQGAEALVIITTPAVKGQTSDTMPDSRAGEFLAAYLERIGL